MLVEQGRSLVDSDIQLDHQPSTESELNSDDPDDDPPGGDGGSPVTPATNPPSDDKGGELLNDQQMPAWHSRLNACKTLDDAMEFHTAIHCLSQKQRDQLELSVPQERWVWLWSLPGVEEEPLEPQPEPLTQSDLVLEPDLTVSKPQPTLSELKALLNACDSLVQLNELKRKHKKTIDEAYDSMSEEEQAHVDAIRALAVPYKVFKYLGEEIKLGTERLHRGMLVYIDPQTHVRATASSVPVWAINGVSAGWKRPIDVSLSVLREVVKVVCKSQNQDGDQQLGLI